MTSSSADQVIPIRCDAAIYVRVALDSRFRGNDELGIGASQHVYEGMVGLIGGVVKTNSYNRPLINLVGLILK